MWTPEHFFVAAVASCFVTTFKAIADFSRFSFESLDVSAEGILEKVDSGYKFTQVILKPKLVVPTDAEADRGTRLLEKSERACLVSRSLSSEVKLQPEVTSAAGRSAV
jgi:organic hydroperoxide reductase OsmC/OhrA